MTCKASPAGSGAMFLRKHAAEPNSKVGLLCQDRGSGLVEDQGPPLSTDEAAWITGQVINSEGGLRRWV